MYDGDGGRVAKRIAHGAEITTTTYIGSLYEVTDDTARKYIFAGANRIATIEPNHTYYSHSDHLGSSNVVTDETGTQVGLTEFTPYGSTFKQTGSYDPKHKFTGKELDASTGLYYYGARYYDHELGRFITADTIVQAPYDPQSLNRYAYCRNNPINYVDPTGHWSWKKFWNSFAGAFLGAVVAVVTGGLGAPLWAAGMYAGIAGGALTGGLEGGWEGALKGAGIGGALGGLLGWGGGIAQAHKMTGQFIAGMLIAGAGVAGATNSWDSFAGGLTGGLAGWGVGKGITSAYKQQFANFRAGNGFVSNRTAAFKAYEQQIKALHDLNVNRADTTVKVISRPLGKGANLPGSTTGPRHNTIISDKLPNGKWEMGPSEGIIETTNTVGNLSEWGTHLTTENSLALGGSYAKSFDVRVNIDGLTQAMNLYDTMIAGNYAYSAAAYNSFNSNYAVNSLIYGGGADYQGNSYRAPGFPDGPQ